MVCQPQSYSRTQMIRGGLVLLGLGHLGTESNLVPSQICHFSHLILDVLDLRRIVSIQHSLSGNNVASHLVNCRRHLDLYSNLYEICVSKVWLLRLTRIVRFETYRKDNKVGGNICNDLIRAQRAIFGVCERS